MGRQLISGIIVLLLAVSHGIAFADMDCNDPEEKKLAAKVKDAMDRADKSGKPDQLYVAYQGVINNGYCLSKAVQDRARAANLTKLGRDAAAKAEAAGLLYSDAPVGGEGKTSAFAWFETLGAFADADRVMLKAVHAKPDDIKLFQAAWETGERARHPSDGGDKSYKAPASYRQELEKAAAASAAKLMAAEEKDAAGLTGNIMTVGAAAPQSLKKLEQAADWMKFTPGGDKPAKTRAEQRGDVIMKQGNYMMADFAERYYRFAGSPKAVEAKKKGEEGQRAMEQSAKKVESSITHKSEADQKKFDKGKANLEKELGF